MIAKDILSIKGNPSDSGLKTTVNWDMPVFDVLPRLLDTPLHELGVTQDGEQIGIIDETSLLEGIGRMIAPRDDCSIIEVECTPQDYSASSLAHAVEDSEAHLVDVLSVPAENGMLRVSLRVRHSDPSAAARSLERYGFNVIDTYSSANQITSVEIAAERLLSLQAIMNV